MICLSFFWPWVFFRNVKKSLLTTRSLCFKYQLIISLRLLFLQNILKDVNSKVAEKVHKARLLDIYHKLDAKSNIAYNGRKFKKSDILSANRKLMFEGVGTLIQAKNRTILVTVVILSDIMIFLQESNQKYFLIMPENKVSFFSFKNI